MTREQLQRRILTVLVTVVAILALAIFNVWYTNHVDERRERDARKDRRELCSFIVAMDDALRSRPPGSPPLQPTGERLLAVTHELRARYHCDNL